MRDLSLPPAEGMAPDGYEIELNVLEALFLAICCIGCYGFEICTTTSWVNLWPNVNNGWSRIWTKSRTLKSRIRRRLRPSSDKEQDLKSEVDDPPKDSGQIVRRADEKLALGVAGTATSSNQRRKRLLRILCLLPAVLWLLALAPVFAQFHHRSLAELTGNLAVDADIGGIGV